MNHYRLPNTDEQHAIPFPNESLDSLESLDLLHKCPRRKIPAVLLECKRVLKKGGIVTIRVPNLDSVIRTYDQGAMDFEELDCWVYGRQDHEQDYVQTGFDPHTITQYLSNADFIPMSVRMNDFVQMNVKGRKPYGDEG